MADCPIIATIGFFVTDANGWFWARDFGYWQKKWPGIKPGPSHDSEDSVIT